MRKVLIQTFAASASIASVFTAAFMGIPRTEATATGCVRNAYSCISVRGDSLHVDYIQGGAQLSSGESITGHMQIRGEGFDVNTRERKYKVSSCISLSSLLCKAIDWSEPIYLNRNLRDGSQVCSRFWRKVGNHHESTRSDYACETIEK